MGGCEPCRLNSTAMYSMYECRWNRSRHDWNPAFFGGSYVTHIGTRYVCTYVQYEYTLVVYGLVPVPALLTEGSQYVLVRRGWVKGAWLIRRPCSYSWVISWETTTVDRASRPINRQWAGIVVPSPRVPLESALLAQLCTSQARGVLESGDRLLSILLAFDQNKPLRR